METRSVAKIRQQKKLKHGDPLYYIMIKNMHDYTCNHHVFKNHSDIILYVRKFFLSQPHAEYFIDEIINIQNIRDANEYIYLISDSRIDPEYKIETHELKYETYCLIV